MTNEEILKAKEQYYNLLKLREEILDAKNIVLNLDVNPDVQKYKQILQTFYYFNDAKFKEELEQKISWEKVKTKEDYLNESFDPISMTTTNSNGIYVFLGKQIIVRGEFFPAPSNVASEDCVVLFYELETQKHKWLPYRCKEDFLKEHTVIFIPEVNDFGTYRKFRANFFSEILDNPQEEVVQKILGKYKLK